MKNLFLTALCLSVICASATSSERTKDSMRLNIVFPLEGDTLNFNRVRFSGSCLPDAGVWFKGEQVKVYSTGAFVGITEIHEGWNYLIFRAMDRHGVINDTVRIFHEYSPFEYPEIPTSVEHSSIFPLSDLWLMPGEKFHAGFLGSPNGTAFLSIPGMPESIEVPEVTNRHGSKRRGYYKVELKTPASEIEDVQPLFYYFQGKDGHAFKFTAPGQLRVLNPKTVLVGVTNDSTNLIRRSLAGQILYELPAGVRMQIIGKYDNFFKVRFAKNKEYFIHQNSITLLPDGRYPYSAIGGMRSFEDDTHIQLDFLLSDLVPYEIHENNGKGLEVFFYRAVRGANWVEQLQENPAIKKVTFRQKESDILAMKIEMQHKQSWGYTAGYHNKTFQLRIKKRPAFSGSFDLPLSGITFCIDPGHGGEYKGGVSSTGLKEEDVNLKIAHYVADLLTSHGARAILTRNGNTTLSLPDRVRIAQMTGTDIFVSIHNNSIPANANPIKLKGTSVFYSHPQSHKLAESIYKRMTGLGLDSYETRYAPFVVTRQTGFLSVLVEGAFLTHPEDEMLLLNDEFRRAMAGAIVEGIMNFLSEAAPDSMNEAIKTSSLQYIPSSN